MNFEKSYKYLKDTLKEKIMTISELNNIVISTEQFDNVDGYSLLDCITSDNQCSFNSYENNEGTKVINIDILFLNSEDLDSIKEMELEDEEINSIKIKINNVDYYNIKNN